MDIIIGSARCDENGKYRGGKVGDQTGKEVSTQKFYVSSKGWYILRPKNVSHANALANKMLQACNNSNIGYDQSNRLGIITYGIETKTKTECDCSSLVRQCIKEALGKDVGNFTTANEVATLVNCGWFDKIVYTSSTILYNGDILVTKTSGHTAIVTSGNPRVTKNPKYQAHVQNQGWINSVGNGEICGTTGKSQRLEAIKINPDGYTIKVRVHIANDGWTAFKTITTETTFGTVGQSKAIEAIEIIGVGCTVKYQAHMKDKGWGIIYTNGGVSGTVGQSRPIEAMKIWIN